MLICCHFVTWNLIWVSEISNLWRLISIESILYISCYLLCMKISEAAAFNMEYAKWLEDHIHHMGRLQAAVEHHLSDDDIQFCVDNCIAHYDNLMHRKSMIVKADVFHIYSGMWKTPVERFFLWIGGFRPSKLIQVFIFCSYKIIRTKIIFNLFNPECKTPKWDIIRVLAMYSQSIPSMVCWNLHIKFQIELRYSQECFG